LTIISVGDVSYETGPNGLQAANHLTASLIENGIEVRRFKTGTPARVIFDHNFRNLRLSDKQIFGIFHNLSHPAAVIRLIRLRTKGMYRRTFGFIKHFRLNKGCINIFARMGLNTICFTVSCESIAMMPCNPNIGGSSKGHLVREIDALGGEPYIRHNFPPTCPRNGRHCTTFTLFTHAEAFKNLICKVIFYFFTNNISVSFRFPQKKKRDWISLKML